MAYLILEDGTVYEGTAFGSLKNSVGEVVFHTGMTGYEMVLTDPSYYGQIVIMTYPLIGNYGVNEQDLESGKVFVNGFIVRELCPTPSNWASQETLDEFLKKYNICGIEGIDTRALTRKIREAGTMRGMISMDYPSDTALTQIKGYKIEDSVKNTTCSKKYEINCDGLYNLAVIDYGLKRSILESLTRRKTNLTIFPSSVSADEIKAGNFDGIILTNGPGNPKDNVSEIKELKKLIGFKPIFGIGLGYQLLVLAEGGDTVKLKYGHRGENYPVKDLTTGKVYITSQNHGYSVVGESLKGAEVSHINWNDRTCEGVIYKNSSASGVQFQPEVSPCPLDTGYLYDNFIKVVKTAKNKQKSL